MTVAVATKPKKRGGGKRQTHDPVTAYAQAVVDGALLTGRAVRQACERHLRDLARQRTPDFPYYFDAEAAEHVIAFFPNFLTLENGDPFILPDWLQFCYGSLFGWKRQRDTLRRFRAAYIETGKGSGKALAVDTPIPTPAGWTTMGALRPGDLVFDEGGRPTKVIGAFDTMVGHECFEVVFDDGSSIVADAEHLWYTEQRTTVRPDGRIGSYGVPMAQRGQWRKGVRSTREILRTLRYPNGKYQSSNHSIPLAGPLGTDAAPLPIEPYTFGVWLGDGDSDCGRVTVDDGDAELLEHLAAVGAQIGERKQSLTSPRTPRYRITGGTAVLRSCGLLKNKHIPPQYLRASVDQRLALLQGLMDTDGYIGKENGECEFGVTSQALAEGALELIVSLGIKATIREKPARLNGRVISSVWRIKFHPPADLPVFRLRRKLQHQRIRHQRRRLSGDRRIVDVRPVPSVPVRCIAVESPSRLFLAGRAMVPTHNTPSLAGVGIYCLIDEEQAGEIYSAAFDTEQASIIINDAIRMAEAEPELEAVLDIGKYNLAHPESRSYFRAVSSEHRSKSGQRPYIVLVDELHEHREATVVNKMIAGFKNREQPLIIEITNAGFDRTSICWQHHEMSIRVLEQVVTDEEWFAYVCHLDPCEACANEGHRQPNDACTACDQWTDPKVWIKANPSLGVVIQPAYLEKQVARALAMPGDEDLVRRLNFCIWTQSYSRAIDMGKWTTCPPMPSESDLRGAEVFGCLDLGETDDFTAWGKLYLLKDGNVAVKMRYYLPSIALERYPNRPYNEWRRAGILEVTPGEVTDYAFVRAQILADFKAEGIVQVCYDTKTARETAQLLMAEGVDMVPMTQGFALNEAIKRLLSMVVAGQIHHGNEPVLTWMASNLVVLKGTKGELRIAKERAPEKIDGIAALVMGIEGAIVRRERTPPPQYQMLFLGGR